MDWTPIFAGILVGTVVLIPFIILIAFGIKEVRYVNKHGPRPDTGRKPSSYNHAGSGYWI